jgi:biopolymer transport protein ExbD
MALQAGTPGSSADEDEAIAVINTTPLVDVMLVLLIIFLITIPVVTHTVPVSLPKESSQPNQTRPENIHLSVDREGNLYWEQSHIDLATLKRRLLESAGRTPQPEVQIRGDQRAHYDTIGRILLACQQAGVSRVGFVTEPPATP